MPNSHLKDSRCPNSNREFKELKVVNGIKHTSVPPYQPASDGVAERSVQILKRALGIQVLNSYVESNQVDL